MASTLRNVVVVGGSYVGVVGWLYCSKVGIISELDTD